MERRDFLKTATVSTMAALFGCAPRLPEPGWQVSGNQADDIRLRVLECAILAPNSHNVQPWLVETTSANTMKLYVDKSRLLPASDPLARQIQISQGTFLELLDIAAREFGYRTNISYFPEGEYASAVVEERPVAALELQLDPSTVKDSLFSQIPKRHTNKRPYDVKRPVSAAELAKVYSLAGTDRILWRAITSEPQRTAVAEICREARPLRLQVPREIVRRPTGSGSATTKCDSGATGSGLPRMGWRVRRNG